MMRCAKCVSRCELRDANQRGGHDGVGVGQPPMLRMRIPARCLMPSQLIAITALLALALSAATATAADPGSAAAKPRPRARDLGVPFDGTPGPLNAITDVDGVLVGHTTLIAGSGRLIVRSGPVRNGGQAV